jgi:hypothetical protein
MEKAKFFPDFLWMSGEKLERNDRKLFFEKLYWETICPIVRLTNERDRCIRFKKPFSSFAQYRTYRQFGGCLSRAIAGFDWRIKQARSLAGNPRGKDKQKENLDASTRNYPGTEP